MTTSVHVSRVSKDYAPNGYSITRSRLRPLNAGTGGANGGGEGGAPLGFFENGDAVVRKLVLFSPYDTSAAVADDVAHHWTITVEVLGTLGPPGPPSVISTVRTQDLPAGGGPAGPIGRYEFPLNGAIIPNGSMVFVEALETAGVGLGTNKDFGGMIGFEYDSRA